MALSSTQYREHLPIPALRGHVRVVWELSGPCDQPLPQRMVPDGAMSWWINFGAPLAWPDGDGSVPPGGTLFIGEIRRPFALSSSGALDVVGVSFWPGRARTFVDVPPRELVDRLSVDPPLAATLSRQLARSVNDADPGDRVALVQAALARALVAPRAPSGPVRRALELLERGAGTLRIATLADTVGLSPRQLERRFADEVGVAPKALASVLRFRRALDAMTSSRAEFATIARSCGYADQAHLVREFTRFTGSPPTRFLAEDAPRARAEWLRDPAS
ncbi:helix-turn-helix domain-containing protein [Sandaracinus amylolyticus]|uniref:Transcriptional regulator, AraC family protein n=1 Tax=Sandaracinus amylolyticus TaxID=927083 RepID=A0A0F6WAM0_9BACT|nr:AraC family transcriptional regulator [Sandaracinus amylolyticus]AKF11615.1 Transcriptional regulator, AraC family protein [Sandaracinus amylolyticus]